MASRRVNLKSGATEPNVFLTCDGHNTLRQPPPVRTVGARTGPVPYRAGRPSRMVSPFALGVPYVVSRVTKPPAGLNGPLRDAFFEPARLSKASTGVA